MDKDKITYFAQTDSRNKLTPFGVRAEDRLRHVYVIGKTGMGKSTLLENMAVQDIQSGEGMVFIDPHGKTADLLLEYVPEHRIKDVVYFAPFDTEYPISLNVLENVDDDKRHLVVTGLMSAFKKIWVDAWSARMEHILANTLFALLEYPGATLLGVNRMFADKDYRKKVVDNIKDPSVKSYWTDEFAKYTEKYVQEATPAIQNKIGQFTGNPLIRNIIGQPTSSLDIRKAMDEKKILIINLSKGRLGEGNANLLGSMIITKIYLAAMSRADLTDDELKRKPNFYMYVDEFQSFANESFADILSEARKYKLGLTIAHQYIEQMSDEVRAAVFGNVGTMITFRIGATDADVLEKEFSPVFEATDMVSLGFAQIYLKLMIGGVGSHPFSATTLPPIPAPEVSSKEAAIASSRAQFAKPQAEVEAAIKEWYKPVEPDIKQKPKTGEDTRTQDERPSLKPTVAYVAPEDKDKKPPAPSKKKDEHPSLKPTVSEVKKPVPAKKEAPTLARTQTPIPAHAPSLTPTQKLTLTPTPEPVNIPTPSPAERPPEHKLKLAREEMKKKISSIPISITKTQEVKKEAPMPVKQAPVPVQKTTPAPSTLKPSTPPKETISLNSLKPNMPRQRAGEGREVMNSKNRASLRDALSDALKEAKEPKKPEVKKENTAPLPTPPPVPQKPHQQEAVKDNPTPPRQAPHQPKQAPQSAFRPPQTNAPTGNASAPREVPADVLRDVLE